MAELVLPELARMLQTKRRESVKDIICYSRKYRACDYRPIGWMLRYNFFTVGKGEPRNTSSLRESSVQSDAEGATAPETLRPKNREDYFTLERGATIAPADGITLSGERTEGAPKSSSIEQM